MNTVKYLTSLARIAAFMTALPVQSDAQTTATTHSQNAQNLNPEQQKYKAEITSRQSYPFLAPAIKNNLNFSQMLIDYPKGSGYIVVPVSKDLSLTFNPHKVIDTFANFYCFGATLNTLNPEYILPQHKKNAEYTKTSTAYFKVPQTKRGQLTPEQAQDVETLYRVMQKNIDFLMNEPFCDINAEDLMAGKYLGKVFSQHRPYKADTSYPNPIDFSDKFKETETPLEFEINNKLGRFMSLAQIATFDNTLTRVGENTTKIFYCTGGGYFVEGVRMSLVGSIENSAMEDPNAKVRPIVTFPPNVKRTPFSEHDAYIQGRIKTINRAERDGIKETFPKLIKGLERLLKERGVDTKKLPDIKSPTVPLYHKYLTLLYTRAKAVKDKVMALEMMDNEHSETLLSGTLADYISPETLFDINQPEKVSDAKPKIPQQKGRQK